jgi:hypothetical protein
MMVEGRCVFLDVRAECRLESLCLDIPTRSKRDGRLQSEVRSWDSRLLDSRWYPLLMR